MFREQVEKCIYHAELAKAAYAKNVAGIARACMLRESNIVKFVGEASVLRPAYYIGIDTRYKLVVMGIRGTHSVHDIITDLASEGEQSSTFEGLSAHFGSAEAAHWFLKHETATLKKCLEENKVGGSWKLVDGLLWLIEESDSSSQFNDWNGACFFHRVICYELWGIHLEELRLHSWP